jgi:hypothetical protein
MSESQEEIRTQDAQPTPSVDGPQAMLDTLRSENEGLKARLAEAARAVDSREDSDTLLREAHTENQQLRSRLAASAAGVAVSRAAEQLGIPAAMGRMHAHKFQCDVDADGEATITPDPVEFFEAELKRDPTLRAAADNLAAQQRASAATVGAVDVEKVDPVELLASLDRNPARKTRFIARHGVQAYLELCSRARRC